MQPVDVFLAILVALIWELGFVANRLALDELSPSMMTALRFTVGAFAVLMISPDSFAIGNLMLLSRRTSALSKVA